MKKEIDDIEKTHITGNSVLSSFKTAFIPKKAHYKLLKCEHQYETEK